MSSQKSRLFLIAVEGGFFDGLCLVEWEAIKKGLMPFFAVWGEGQNGGYAYFQGVDAMTGKAGFATATLFP